MAVIYFKDEFGFNLIFIPSIPGGYLTINFLSIYSVTVFICLNALIIGPTYADYADACTMHNVSHTFLIAEDSKEIKPDLKMR